MRFFIMSLVLVIFSQAHATPEVLQGKTASNGKCAVRVDLEKDLVSFTGDNVSFGFFVTKKAMDEALKKGQKYLIITGEDGPVRARMTLDFSETGAIESAQYSQKTFIRSQRVKCSDLK
jgi:hypothetical protein